MNDGDNQSQESAMPEKLRAALSRLNARQIEVPSKVDDAILRSAREHLSEVAKEAHLANRATKPTPNPSKEGNCRSTSNVRLPSLEGLGVGGIGLRGWFAELRSGLLEFIAVRHWAALGGVAVTIVAVGALVWLGGHPRLAARLEDLNGDGVVDMLDAFALARELQLNPASHPQLDLNGDGKVDERDVQALASRAVRLEQGGRS